MSVIVTQSPNLPQPWTIYDVQTAEFAAFPFNPTKTYDIIYSKPNQYAQIAGGVGTLFYSQDDRGKGEFDGSAFGPSDLAFYNHWFSKDGTCIITDDLGRQTALIFETFTATRTRKAAVPWFHEIKATFIVWATIDF